MIPMIKPIKIIKMSLGILLFIASLFSFVGTGFSQTLDPALTEAIREMITNSIALTVAFTSTDAVSAGWFVYEEEGEKTRFSTMRIPVRHFFSRFRDSRYAPFITGSLGYFEDRETVQLGDPPDESRFKAVTISLGGGIKVELIKKYLWLTPEIDLIYGRTWNEHDYNSEPSKILIKPQLEGVGYNWQVDTFTFAPSLQLACEYPVRVVTLGFDTKFTYLNIRKVREDYPEHKVKSDSTLWRNRFRLVFPLGVSVLNMPLSLRGDFSRVEFGGDVARPLKESHFYEVGTELAFDTSRNVKWLNSLSIGAGYTFSQRINGWSFRFDSRYPKTSDKSLEQREPRLFIPGEEKAGSQDPCLCGLTQFDRAFVHQGDASREEGGFIVS
jgi:hypothetical protein